MTVGKNFSGQPTPSIIDGEYRRCNFSQPTPIDVAGQKRGVRLFPTDDTPRTFIECNLTNAEPPPGSTLVQCLTVVKEHRVITSTDTITIDGVSETVDHYSDLVYGRFDPATESYVDLASPEEQVID